MSQMVLFAEPERKEFTRCGADDWQTPFTAEETAEGRKIMLDLIEQVNVGGWSWGPVDHFVREHFGLVEGETMSWFCSMYHQSPLPGSGAFEHFMDHGGPGKLVRCAAYRATFAWMVALALQHEIDVVAAVGRDREAAA